MMKKKDGRVLTSWHSTPGRCRSRECEARCGVVGQTAAAREEACGLLDEGDSQGDELLVLSQITG
jgi:hypothetical protein